MVGVAERVGPAQLARLLRLPEPTSEQAAVIAAPLGPLAVIAGAGSGKSETMAARLVWLVANGMVRPERVLGLTFTRKASAEFGDRVRSRLDRLRRAGLDGLGDLDGDPVIGTYHAYAGRLVSDNALREGLEPSMRLITPALSWQLAASIVAAYDGPMDEIGWTPQTVTAAVLELAGDLAEHLRGTGDVFGVGGWLDAQLASLPGRVPQSVMKIMATQRAREQLLPLIDLYAAAKRTREVLDHGDQMALAARIAARHPETGAGERSRYQVVLLDEYQDTSHAQLVLLRSLFGGGHPVTAVGDPCQSIYGWRGAQRGHVDRFPAEFPDRRGRRRRPPEPLTASWRNRPEILTVANQISGPPLATGAHRVRRTAGRGRPASRTARSHGPVRAAQRRTRTRRHWMADQIPAACGTPRRRRRIAPPSTVNQRPTSAVWSGPAGRSADRAGRCAARGLPVEVVGLGGLLDYSEVRDVVCTLRVLAT